MLQKRKNRKNKKAKSQSDKNMMDNFNVVVPAINFKSKILREIDASLQLMDHPIREVISKFQDVVLKQIDHFNKHLVDSRSILKE